MPAEFTDDVVLDVGHWDRRFARVLAKVVVGDQAVAVVDSNGAAGGRTYENLETYRWDPDAGWTAAGSGSLGEAGWEYGLAYAAGEAEPGTRVTVVFDGVDHEVEAAPTGYWLFAVPLDEADLDLAKLPRPRVTGRE